MRIIIKYGVFILLLTVLFSGFLLSGCNEKTDLTSTSLVKTVTNGKPSLAEFGRGTCIPCKAMKPILEDLSVEYKNKLNVIIVEVDSNMELTRQFDIMVIPTQIFFNSDGKEVSRHVGYYAREEIITQLTEMGIE